ncbi:MAG: hypothetical protein WHV66_01655 [Anaerolineales bacterium]
MDSTNSGYWEDFHLSETDIEFLYNYLLEVETPQTTEELLCALIRERIRVESDKVRQSREKEGKIYRPKDDYIVGQKLIFPALNWQKGQVVSIRIGNNPELPPFSVIEVLFEDGSKRSFASGLEDHILNQPIKVEQNGVSNLNADYVFKKYGNKLLKTLTGELETKPDLVRIAGRWFARALLVDVNMGYLNMAEALLDMEGGGPLPTQAILRQIELPSDVNLKLTEFSLNFALQEDGRFDEVGPSGEVLWFLRRLEPDDVKNTPLWLKYSPINFDAKRIEAIRKTLMDKIADELEVDDTSETTTSQREVAISLSYPHWRAGTLPLSNQVKGIFPTAIESPRIRFTFVDGETQRKFPGWVVREKRYVFGLKEWFTSLGLIPGSLIFIQPGKTSGEVVIRVEKRRSTREWIRTALVGTDGGVVFALLKQVVTAVYDERMAIVVPDVNALDQVWENTLKQRVPLEKTILSVMRELAKLTPQGNVHAQELYAAVNTIRRCPPSPMLSLLLEDNRANYLGDLYFRLNETLPEEKEHA